MAGLQATPDPRADLFAKIQGSLDDLKQLVDRMAQDNAKG
jgi:hypothetical protein